jgi:hypothetical protein
VQNQSTMPCAMSLECDDSAFNSRTGRNPKACSIE